MNSACIVLVFGALGPFSSCTDLRDFVLGVPPIEEKPIVLDPGPIASQTQTSPGEPDPRLTIKLPGGGEASYEYAEGKRLMGRGQLVAASFTLMPKALGATGTSDELLLLEELCRQRGDDECLATVKARQAGLKTAGGASLEDLRALAKKNPEATRNLLMPRLEAGTLTDEQAEVLAAACHSLHDKPCESMVEALGR